MQRNLDISTLRALITVIDMASVTKAANKLHLTQSAVSMQIKRLEEALDKTLLERVGRTMKPTADGEHLLRYARRLVAINDEAIDSLSSRDHNGELRFGVPVDLADAYVPDILKKFVAQYPQVAISLYINDTTELLAEYESGKLDLILTTELDTKPNGQCLLSRPLQWTGAVGGQAWTRSPLPIVLPKTCMFRDTAIEALDDAGIEWVDVISRNDQSFASCSVACAADLGIRADIEGFLAAGTEVIDSINSPLPALPRYQVNAYVADGPNQKIADIFVRFIESAFADEHPTDFCEERPLEAVPA